MFFAKSDKFGGAAHAAVNLRAVESHIFRPERDIFIDGLFKELILRILETKPNPEPCGAQGALVFIDILAAEQNSAGIGLQKSVEMLKKGALTGAGMTDYSDYFALFKLHVYILDSGDGSSHAVFIIVGEIFCFKHCHRLTSIIFESASMHSSASRISPGRSIPFSMRR